MSGDPLDRLATAERLLVACDFDGTLSPIVPRPGDARPDPEALAALEALAGLDRTEVAIVSGRSRSTLAALLGRPVPGIRLVGSHGAEYDGNAALSDDERCRRETLERRLERLAAEHDGALVEVKPTGVAFHYRRVDPPRREAAARAARSVRDDPGLPDVLVHEGHMVVEFLVRAADKGTALDRLRRDAHAAATLFVGDDRTDEDAFRRLGPADLGVKVGSGETAAGHRIGTQADVAPLLARVYALRRAAT